MGSTITYTVTVTNLGPDPADAVTLTDTVPQGLTLLSAVPSVGQCVPGDLGNVCNLGTLANQGSATIVIQFTAISAQPVNHTAAASTTTSDPVAANNTATDTTMVVYQPCGAATFQGPNLFPLNGTSQGVTAVADFNHDDRPDLAITVAGTNQIAILLAGPPIPTYINVGSNPTSIVAGDFINDGNPDLGVVNNGSAHDRCCSATVPADCTGGELSVPALPTNAIGDFNGDHNRIGHRVYGAATTNVAVLLGDGRDTSVPHDVSKRSVADQRARCGLRRNGKLDIAVPNTGATTIALLRGNGSGSLPRRRERSSAAGPVARPRDPGRQQRRSPDPCHDRTNNANNLMLLLNTGGGGFAPPVEIIAPIGIGLLSPATSTTEIDLAAVGHFAAIAFVGDGAGHFAQSAAYAVGKRDHIVAVDVNGDARSTSSGHRSARSSQRSTSAATMSRRIGQPRYRARERGDGASFSHTSTTNHGPPLPTRS